MGRAHPLRSGVAVLAGGMLLNFVDATLERILVTAVAGAPPADTAAYLAVRNRPLVLAATLVTHALAATLTGYILARSAAAFEVRHAIAAAAVISVIYAIAFAGANPMLPPVWLRALLLIVTPPALVAGAAVRAQARAIQSERAGTGQAEERS
jgi:hypothetical protein